MANHKYLYFVRHCRELGANEVAEAFEGAAEQETAHTFDHLDLLPQNNPQMLNNYSS